MIKYVNNQTKLEKSLAAAPLDVADLCRMNQRIAMADPQPETINPRTGLRETWSPHFNVPIVHQRSLGALRFTGQRTAVHKVPAGRGLTLDWYARLNPSDELLITLQGANRPAKNIYPSFPRVASMRNKGPAHMAFADPTLMMDKSREMLLSWYLGGMDWDPIPLILRIARKAQTKTKAKHIAFIGGSGGGFAALRASAMTPGSMAFVQEPQTDLRRYSPVPVQKYFNSAWPGWDHAQLMNAFPERFDMVRHYAASRPQNFVYYAQSKDDRIHVKNHFTPFAAAHNVGDDGGVNATGTRVFALYKGAVPGHGKITATEYDTHFAEAMKLWRNWRPS